VNDNTRQRGLYKKISSIGIIIFLTSIFLSGCTETQNTDNSLNSKFIGTWAGSMGVSTFGGFIGSNSTVTKLTFMQDIVAATITNDRGTNTMNYTYTINGNNLILVPSFSGEFIPAIQPNGTQPHFNNTMPPPNGTRSFNNTMSPPNGTRPPFNNTWLSNGEQQPNRQQLPSMSISFLCTFDENYTLLYLDGSKFIKIQ